MSQVTLVIDGIEYTLDPARDCDIDMDDINGELIKVPRLIQQYLTLYQHAIREESKAKIVLNRIEAIVDAKFREESMMAKRKITEKMVKGVVITDPQYKKQQAKIIQLERNVGILKAAVEGIQSKQSSLMSIGANLRASFAPSRILDNGERYTRQETARSMLARDQNPNSE